MSKYLPECEGLRILSHLFSDDSSRSKKRSFSVDGVPSLPSLYVPSEDPHSSYVVETSAKVR